MFNAQVAQTEFVSPEANECFPNIYGESYNGDVSFLSTLRALLYKRVPEGETVEVRFNTTSLGESYVDMCRVQGDEVDDESYYGRIRITGFTASSAEVRAKWLDEVEAKFLPSFAKYGWSELERVKAFFHNAFRVVCYVNTERRCVNVFVDGLDYRKLHYLQCGIFAFLPWYFDPEKGLSKDEIELIKSLQKKTPDAYIAAMAKLAEELDLRSMKIRKMLTGFETRYERQRIVNVEHQITQTNDSIRSYNRQIGDLLSQKNELLITLLGLQARVGQQEGKSELMDYCLCNKNIDLVRVDNDQITFVAKGYLDNFDSDAAERMIANKSSYFYSDNSILNKDQIELLMNALFIDQTLRIKMCAAYRLPMHGCVEAISHYSYGPAYSDCTPNPHIEHFSCLGGYEYEINNKLEEGDYVGAIDQCMASVASVNLTEGPTMNHFVEIFHRRSPGVNNRCIELPDKTVVTPERAVAYLTAEKEKGGNE